MSISEYTNSTNNLELTDRKYEVLMMDTEIFKAFSDENRLRIVNLLMHKELCVCELEVVLEMSQSNVSRHLIKLKQAQIVISKKDSQWVYYSINPHFIENNKHLYAHIQEKFLLDKQLASDSEKLKAVGLQHIICETGKES